MRQNVFAAGTLARAPQGELTTLLAGFGEGNKEGKWKELGGKGKVREKGRKREKGPEVNGVWEKFGSLALGG